MRAAALILPVLAVCACSTGSDTGFEGTVVFLDQQEPLYGVLSDDGMPLEPVNLPPEFAEDGLHVRVEAEFLGRQGRWGELIEIIDIVVSERPPPGDAVVFEGVVTFIDLEGGFFAILGDDGGRYDPIDLPARFAQEDLRVRVAARIRRDLASAHMWGELIDIDSIEVLP